MFVICPVLYLDCNCDVPSSPQPSVSIFVSLLSVLSCFSATPTSAECVGSFLMASFLCFCASSLLSLGSLSSVLFCLSAAVSPDSNSVGVSVWTSIFHSLLQFYYTSFFVKEALVEKTKVLPQVSTLNPS